MVFQQLHERAVQCARNLISAEAELISLLQLIDDCKGYRFLGYSSLFAYALEALKLSNSQTFELITISRKAKEVPELKQAIASGDLTIGKGRRLASVITQENKAEWIHKGITLTQRELEKEIVKVKPREAVKETMTFVKENRVKLVCGVSEELMKNIERVKDLVSQERKRACTLEDALHELVDLYLEREDPVKKARRIASKPNNSSQGRVKSLVTKQRKPIPAAVKHEVILRDQGRCVHINPDGKRCNQGRWTDIHHRVRVAEGGENSADNLEVLCKGHHQLTHEHEQQLEMAV